MPERTQQDIVNKYLQENSIDGPVISDQIRMQGLTKWFEPLPPDAEIKEEKVYIPDLDRAAFRSREELMNLIMDRLFSYPNSVGYKWNLKDNYVMRKYIQGFKQQDLGSNESTWKKFIAYCTMVMKIRADIEYVDWTFGYDAIDVNHRNAVFH